MNLLLELWVLVFSASIVSAFQDTSPILLFSTSEYVGNIHKGYDRLTTAGSFSLLLDSPQHPRYQTRYRLHFQNARRTST